MQLESHATPPAETPQQRYANLHRAIERGLDSDEVWRELAEVSLTLGHADECLRCLRRIQNDTVRLALGSRLARRGLIDADVAANSTDDAVAPSAQHLAAPAASDAGPRASRERPAGESRLLDHLADAVQYQMHQHMPALVLFTTLAFPLVVGIGGFLTAGGSWLLLAAIAALPGLGVLAVVGAMGRQVLLASADGEGDVPPIPPFAELWGAARRFALDVVLVLGSLLGPSLVAAAFSAPWTTVIPGLLVGAFFAPMAWSLRHLRSDFGALSPVTLTRAIARTAASYPGLAVVTMLLFVPAGLVTWVVIGRPVWVQIAMIGPLCVLPMFVASRLLGTWLETNRSRLGGLVQERSGAAAVAKSEPRRAAEPAAPRIAARAPGKEAAPVVGKLAANADRKIGKAPSVADVRSAAASVGQKRTVVAKTAAAANPPRLPKRPEQLEQFRAPVVKRTAAGGAPSAGPKAAKPAVPAARPAPAAAPARAPARAPAPAPAPAPKAKAPAAPKPAPRAIEGRGPARKLNDQPDLSAMPGAVVVSGRDRERQGAAAKKQ